MRTVRAWAPLVAAAAGVGLLFLLTPGRTALFPPCPFHKLTGFYCPGCGSTRAMHQLLHGHVGHALALNPLAVMALPFIGWLIVRDRTAAKGTAHARVLSPTLVWAVLAVTLLYWMARNLPFAPFTLLAPH